jgi:hypothetical protein
LLVADFGMRIKNQANSISIIEPSNTRTGQLHLIYKGQSAFRNHRPYDCWLLISECGSKTRQIAFQLSSNHQTPELASFTSFIKANLHSATPPVRLLVADFGMRIKNQANSISIIEPSNTRTGQLHLVYKG